MGLDMRRQAEQLFKISREDAVLGALISAILPLAGWIAIQFYEGAELGWNFFIRLLLAVGVIVILPLESVPVLKMKLKRLTIESDLFLKQKESETRKEHADILLKAAVTKMSVQFHQLFTHNNFLYTETITKALKSLRTGDQDESFLNKMSMAVQNEPAYILAVQSMSAIGDQLADMSKRIVSSGDDVIDLLADKIFHLSAQHSIPRAEQAVSAEMYKEKTEKPDIKPDQKPVIIADQKEEKIVSAPVKKELEYVPDEDRPY